MYRCRGPISQSKSGVNIIHNTWCITEMHGAAFFALGRGGAAQETFVSFVYPNFSFTIESYIYEKDFTLGLSQKYHF